MRRWCLLFVFVASVSSPAQAAPKRLLEASCVFLYKNQQLAKAASCFYEKSRLLPKSKRYYRGRLMRNAALLWLKAAPKARADKVILYRQKAILLLGIYVERKLCLDPSHCKKVATHRKQLCQLARCAPLKIAITPKNSTITVSAGGYWKRTQEGGFLATLPPGRYRIAARSAGRKSQDLSLILSPLKRHTLQLRLKAPRRLQPPRRPPRRPPVRTPPPKPGLPLLAWIGYIGGGVALVAGGVLLGVGVGNRAAYQSGTWQNPQQAADQDIKKQTLDSALQMAIIGSITLGVGGALLTTGLVAHLLQKGS